MSNSVDDVGPVKGLLVLGAMVLGALGLIGLVIGAQYFWAGRAQPVPWDRVEGTGTLLTVFFTGSECQSSSRVEAEEHADRVVITAHEGVPARSCSDLARVRALVEPGFRDGRCATSSTAGLRSQPHIAVHV